MHDRGTRARARTVSSVVGVSAVELKGLSRCVNVRIGDALQAVNFGVVSALYCPGKSLNKGEVSVVAKAAVTYAGSQWHRPNLFWVGLAL